MKRLNRITTIFLIILSIIICSASVKLGIGELKNPSTGFMPFFTSSLLFSLSIIILIKNFIKEDESGDKKPLFVRENFQRPISLVIGLTGYIFLLKIFGYLITTFLLIFLMLFILDPKLKNCWWYLVIGATASYLSFLVFCKWLQVELPVGMFHIGI